MARRERRLTVMKVAESVLGSGHYLRQGGGGKGGDAKLWCKQLEGGAKIWCTGGQNHSSWNFFFSYWLIEWWMIESFLTSWQLFFFEDQKNIIYSPFWSLKGPFFAFFGVEGAYNCTSKMAMSLIYFNWNCVGFYGFSTIFLEETSSIYRKIKTGLNRDYFQPGKWVFLVHFIDAMRGRVFGNFLHQTLNSSPQFKIIRNCGQNFKFQCTGSEGGQKRSARLLRGHIFGASDFRNSTAPPPAVNNDHSLMCLLLSTAKLIIIS